MSLLDDIIAGAIDDKVSVPTLLRKCLVLAHQLKNEKLKIWVEQELNGYDDSSSLPEYRVVKASATGSFSGPFGNVLNNQPLAASVLDEDLRHWATTAYLTQPIAAYEIGKDEDGNPNSGSFRWPADLVAMYQLKFIKGWALIRASQEIPGSVFTSILDTVRTRILQLALELKDNLPKGSVDATLVPSDVVEKSVVTNIFGGKPIDWT